VNWQPINIGVPVLCGSVVWLVLRLVNFICDLTKWFLGIKVETDNPNDLRKALLNSGFSSDVAEKIVTHYTKEVESF